MQTESAAQNKDIFVLISSLKDFLVTNYIIFDINIYNSVKFYKYICKNSANLFVYKHNDCTVVFGNCSYYNYTIYDVISGVCMLSAIKFKGLWLFMSTCKKDMVDIKTR